MQVSSHQELRRQEKSFEQFQASNFCKLVRLFMMTLWIDQIPAAESLQFTATLRTSINHTP
jgi:hypothetical protein